MMASRDTSGEIITEQNFTRSAGMQLALYALYALIALGVLAYLLSLSIGRGGVVSDSAINVENNSITITLREEPPQLDSGRATDAASFVVIAHTM
mgnify:CR=1 FL=1